MSGLNLVFAGTPEFAVPSLESLIASRHDLLAVYTQPDRPAGRGRKLSPSPVKMCSQRHGLRVAQPERLRDAAADIAALAPDIMIVVAYGQIVPPVVLAIPRYGCVNVHASLLPRWRGAAPIARAIEAGDSVTGISIMQMEPGLDTGPVLRRVESPIAPDDTAARLHDRLADLGAAALLSALDDLERGDVRPKPQDAAIATYASKLGKDEATIDWRLPADVLHRKVRALNPWPVAQTRFRDKRLRLWEVGPLAAAPAASTAAPGTIVAAGADGLVVQTGQGTVTVTRLQAEGGRPLNVAAFINGHRPRPGEILGEAPGDLPGGQHAGGAR